MPLRDRAHRQSVNFVSAPGLQFHELDRRSKRFEIHRERRVRLLALEGLAHRLVASMYPNDVPRNIGRREKRKSHDVIPVKMGHEYVEAIFFARSVLRQDAVAKLARSRSHIA